MIPDIPRFAALGAALLLNLAVCVPCAQAASDRGWPVRMDECAGVARVDWPVTVGIPFQEGALPRDRTLTLTPPNGDAVELQTTTLAHWPDGSAKWVLLDYLADLKAGADEPWRLRIADAPKTQAPLLASETTKGCLVSTGPLRFLASAGAGKPLFRVWLDRNGDGRFDEDESVEGDAQPELFLRLQKTPPGPPDRENWLRDASDDPGELFLGSLDRERKVSIEENGPVRAVVRIDGWHVSRQGRRVFPFTLRIHFFRGSRRLRFQHTFVASEDVKENFLREMGVVLPFGGGNVQATVGLKDDRKTESLGPRDALSVSAIGDPRLYHLVSFRDKKRVHAAAERRTGAVRSKLADGEDPPGWAALATDRGGMALGFRDFQYLHPKELRLEGDGRMVVYLWPERGNKCLDLRRRSEHLDRRYNENGMDPYGGRGIAKTHEWMVEYSAAPPDADAARDLARALNEPIVPYVTPEYYLNTKAFGEFQPHDPKAFPRLEAAVAFGFRYMRALRRAFGLDGMIDWGDIALGGVGQADHSGAKNPEGLPWRGYLGWCNSDFSLAHGFFLHYVRTGDREVLLDGEAMTMHVMDIDTNHYDPKDPTQIGRGHRHDQQHWGNGLRDYCYAPNAAIDLYLLTGNRRAFDVAREMADHFVAAGGGYGRYMTLRFWEITGEEKYRKHAEETLRQDLGKRGREGWPFAIGANFRSKSYDGVGYTFYDSILPKPELRNAFLQALDYLRERYIVCWRTKGHPDHCIFALAHKYAPTPENTEMLKIAVWLAAAGLPKRAEAFDAPEGAPFERLLEINQKTIDLGRTDVFGLYYLVGLPRVMARLKAVGVPEDEAVDYRWQWTDAPSFVEILDNKEAMPSGKSWGYYTKRQSPHYRPDPRMPEEIQRQWRAAALRHALYENDRKLGPTPWSAAYQQRYGRIGWTRRLSNAIRFTTPDNTNPRRNGRTYKLVYVSAEDCKWEDKPSFRETLRKEEIIPFGKAWAYFPRHETPKRVHLVPEPPEAARKWQAAQDRQTFYEDAKVAKWDGRPFDLRDGKRQGWARYQALLVFTTTNGSDPRANGREYLFTYINEADAREKR